MGVGFGSNLGALKLILPKLSADAEARINPFIMGSLFKDPSFDSVLFLKARRFDFNAVLPSALMAALDVNHSDADGLKIQFTEKSKVERFKLVQFLYEEVGQKPNKPLPGGLFLWASLEQIKWIYQRCVPLEDLFFVASSEISTIENFLRVVPYADLAVLEFLIDEGEEINASALLNAALLGNNIEVLEYIHNRFDMDPFVPVQRTYLRDLIARLLEPLAPKPIPGHRRLASYRPLASRSRCYNAIEVISWLLCKGFTLTRELLSTFHQIKHPYFRSRFFELAVQQIETYSPPTREPLLIKLNQLFNSKKNDPFSLGPQNYPTIGLSKKQ